MHPEAAFLAGYSLTLTLIAIGLERLGRCSTDPWASRTLAACRPTTERPAHGEPDWPHSEVPAFHLGLAAVALVAALVLATVSAVRYVGPIELGVHMALLAIVGVRIRHVIVEYRTPTQPLQRRPTPTAVDQPESDVVGRNWPNGTRLERDV